MNELDPKSIAIATATLYPNWHPDQVDNSISQVRGNIAIQSVREATDAGYQIVVVDGGSSIEFKSQLAKLGVQVQVEKQPGMSSGRRQAYREASTLPEVKVICWTEPEKVSFIRDCLPQATSPIITGIADVVVPKRDEEAAGTYPDYQVHFEAKQNRLWNAILRTRNLLLPSEADLDMTFGPKLFKNTPDIKELFMLAFNFFQRGLELDKIIDPELWPDANLLPVVLALHQGKKVVSVTVHYRHPKEQTRIEIASGLPLRKVDVQYKTSVISLIEYIRLLESNPSKKSRLIPIEQG